MGSPASAVWTGNKFKVKSFWKIVVVVASHGSFGTAVSLNIIGLLLAFSSGLGV